MSVDACDNDSWERLLPLLLLLLLLLLLPPSSRDSTSLTNLCTMWIGGDFFFKFAPVCSVSAQCFLKWFGRSDHSLPSMFQEILHYSRSQKKRNLNATLEEDLSQGLTSCGSSDLHMLSFFVVFFF